MQIKILNIWLNLSSSALDTPNIILTIQPNQNKKGSYLHLPNQFYATLGQRDNQSTWKKVAENDCLEDWRKNDCYVKHKAKML